MGLTVLGLGDLAASSNADNPLAAIALGSCVALIMASRDARVIAMAHVVLPDTPPENEFGGKPKPKGYYPATAVAELARLLRGHMVDVRNTTVKLVGGGRIGTCKNTYRIGKRNVMGVRRELWKLGLVPIAEHVGKQVPLTVDVRPGTQGAIVTSPGEKEIIL